jgi:hypothetical protein
MHYVGQHFQKVFGKPVTAKKSLSKLKHGPTDKWFGAWYELDDHTICGAIIADMPFSAICGTAMALTPAAQAQQMAKTGNFDELSLAVLFEVMNVSSHLFHRAFEKQVTIVQVAAWNGKPPAEVFPKAAMDLMNKPAQRHDLVLEVGGGYGSGVVALGCS